MVVTDRSEIDRVGESYAGSGSPRADFGRLYEGCVAAVDTSLLLSLGTLPNPADLALPNPAALRTRRAECHSRTMKSGQPALAAPLSRPRQQPFPPQPAERAADTVQAASARPPGEQLPT